jgi:hypothetical protein
MLIPIELSEHVVEFESAQLAAVAPFTRREIVRLAATSDLTVIVFAVQPIPARI